MKLIPSDEGVFAWIGQAFVVRGETEKAIEYLSEKIGKNESSSALFQTRAEAYSKKGDLERAVSDYSKAIEYNDAPGLLYSRARLLKELGKKDAALRDFLSILKKFPDFQNARIQAIALGAKEIELPKEVAPKNDKPAAAAKKAFQLAFEKMTAGGKDTGLYYFEKAASADQDFALPFYYIGFIYETKILFGDAFKAYSAAEKINGLLSNRFCGTQTS